MRFNKGFSNPSFRKVKAYFNRFGYDRYKPDFYATLRGEAQATKNMLNHLIDIRNNIAHGDLSETKTPNDLKEMKIIVVRFCRVTDKIFATWCKENFCPIR